MTTNTTGRARPGSRRSIDELTAAIDRLLGPPPPEADPVEVERFTTRACGAGGSVRVSFVRSNRRSSAVAIIDEATGARVQLDPGLLADLRTALDDLAAYLGTR